MTQVLKQGLLILVAFSFAISFSASSVEAKSHFETLSQSTQQDLELIQHLVDNPSLINSSYIDCYAGQKASTNTAPSSKSLRSPTPVSKIFWQDSAGQSIRYQLEQSKASPTLYLTAFQCFFHAQKEDVRIEDLDKLLNEQSKGGYDEEGRFSQIYSFDSQDQNNQTQQNRLNTQVFAYQDSHLIGVTRILVKYSGPPLPPPSAADMKAANDFRRKNAFEHYKSADYMQATSLLQAHLQAHPEDAEAHIKLAELYKAQSCLNESIAEYRAALSECGNNKDLRNQCVAGLHELKVEIPPPIAMPPPINQPVLQERININPSPNNTLFSPPTNGPKNLDVGF